VANDEKLSYILIGIYQALYKKRYNKVITVNKYREKWAMQDVIDTVGYDRAKELLKYYLALDRPSHPLQFFYYNFDKMDYVEKEIQKDKANRSRLLVETKRMVEGEE
jgi:hypothetical protein